MSRSLAEMTPAERTIDRLKTLIVVVGMLGVAGIFIYFFQDQKREDAAFAASARYTVGEVTRTSYVIGPSSGSIAFFSYQVGDSTYASSYSGESLEVGQRFLVKFSGQQPGYRVFYNRVPIPPSITDVPLAGWPEPPFEVPAELLE
ncbi:MAG: hypothetical protein H7Z21_20545 [Hymenobacter sp.]|nr:hypothetical protein [Hymenobacter sp.]